MKGWNPLFLSPELCSCLDQLSSAVAVILRHKPRVLTAAATRSSGEISFDPQVGIDCLPGGRMQVSLQVGILNSIADWNSARRKRSIERAVWAWSAHITLLLKHFRLHAVCDDSPFLFLYQTHSFLKTALMFGLAAAQMAVIRFAYFWGQEGEGLGSLKMRVCLAACKQP